MRPPRVRRERSQNDAHMYRTQKGIHMNRTDQSGHDEVRSALNDLRARTAASLQTFNNAVPHASWLRRSEIERFTADLLWAAERAPRRRQSTPLGKMKNAFSWVARLRIAARIP